MRGSYRGERIIHLVETQRIAVQDRHLVKHLQQTREDDRGGGGVRGSYRDGIIHLVETQRIAE